MSLRDAVIIPRKNFHRAILNLRKYRRGSRSTHKNQNPKENFRKNEAARVGRQTNPTNRIWPHHAVHSRELDYANPPFETGTAASNLDTAIQLSGTAIVPAGQLFRRRNKSQPQQNHPATFSRSPATKLLHTHITKSKKRSSGPNPPPLPAKNEENADKRIIRSPVPNRIRPIN